MRTRNTIVRLLGVEGVDPLNAEEKALEAILRMVHHTCGEQPDSEQLGQIVREALVEVHVTPEGHAGIVPPALRSFDEIDEVRALFARSALSYRQRRIIGMCLQGQSRREILEATGMTAAQFHLARSSAIRVLRRTRDMLRARRPEGPVEWHEISHAVMLGHGGPASISWFSADGRVHRFPPRRNRA